MRANPCRRRHRTTFTDITPTVKAAEGRRANGSLERRVQERTESSRASTTSLRARNQADQANISKTRFRRRQSDILQPLMPRGSRHQPVERRAAGNDAQLVGISMRRSMPWKRSSVHC
jgi:hypothetical protein